MNTPVKADRATNLQTPGAAAPDPATLIDDKPASIKKADKTSDRVRSRADLRTMRAADIDPATLTAPVMTADGWLCPPTPEKK